MAIQTSNLIVSFKPVAFRFALTCFVSNKVILMHWIHLSNSKLNSKWIPSEFEVNFQKIEFKCGFEAFNIVQDLIFNSFENDRRILPILKRAMKTNTLHLSVITFEMYEIGSMEEIGKSLSFSEVSWSVIKKYKFLFCVPRYFS